MKLYYLSLCLISIGILFDTLHSLFYYQKYYSKSGIFNVNILVNNKQDKSVSKLLKVLFPIVNEKGFYYILLLRLALSLLILFMPHKFYNLIFLVFLTQLVFNLRNTLALSGADQMRTIILFGLSIISLMGHFLMIGSLFIVCQLYISYFFTGYNKIRSPIWRQGKAMVYVLNSELFGNRAIQNFVINLGRGNKILCWGIILFQLTFPLFASIQFTNIYFLVVGIIFHLILAIISNLNDFFWTFISAYPIVYYVVFHL
ncbi:hypothetical protein DRF65_20600 [Chryseobacterium pennae]|uniref:HTTM-like domain-containing protein n=1 Tax=Chryseobacterium pennae TaxID=2258962 RepID=A0A3D9C4H9_9FLAO|nr:hypothetical protein DRF65_20600 [Chryseobacterium pennae]